MINFFVKKCKKMTWKFFKAKLEIVSISKKTDWNSLEKNK